MTGSDGPVSDAPRNAGEELERPAESCEQTALYRVYGVVAERFEQALADGCEPDVEDLVAEFPGLRSELEQLVATLRELHGIGETADASAPMEPLNPTSRALGDFQILREIGRGGMGVVYEAAQVSLGRRVALKVLNHVSLLAPRRLQRFRNEATAAASLHHPHIVPVFAVGSEDNIHYYAMQLIDGQSLADEIDGVRDAAAEFSEPGGSTSARDGEQERFRQVASDGIEVARALQFAHDRGIVHRDIKPSNLLRDKEGKIWVADFGLAQIEADAGLTATGDVLGTLRYMSPEQASGGSGLVDQRADVYSLGATLYELLTLQPLYAGFCRVDLIRAITSESESPTPIYRVAPSVPVDLQTIVMKALAKEPADRYRSAGQMADDLQRFLNHEPIVARPISATERLVKWLRRHRTLAASAFLALLFSTLVLTLTTLLVWREQAQTVQALTRAERFARESRVLQRQAEAAAESARLSAQKERRQSEFAQCLLYASDMKYAHQALLDGDLPLLRRLLNSHLPADGRPDVRGFEWWWLQRRSSRARRTITQGDQPFYCLALSSDGRRLACAGASGSIHLHDWPSGVLVRTFASGQREVNSLDFAPDDTTLASAGDDGSVCIWDIASGQRVTRIQVSEDLLFGALFTPDGKSVITCGQGTLIGQWDVRTGAARGRFGAEGDGHGRTVEALAMSPDGRLLASISGDQRAIVWDVASRQRLMTLPTGREKGTWVAFSPDGRALATGNADGSVFVWNVMDWRSVTHAKHRDGVHCLAFDADGNGLLTADREGSIWWWDLQTPGAEMPYGETRPVFVGFRGQSAYFLDYESVARVAGTEGVQTSGGKLPERVVKALPARLVSAWQAHRERIYSLLLDSRNGTLLSASADGSVAAWSEPATEQSGTLWERSSVADFAFFPDSQRLVLASEGSANVVSANRGAVMQSHVPHGRAVSSVAVGPGEMNIALGFSDGRVRLLNSNMSCRLGEWLFVAKGQVRSLRFSSDGSRLGFAPWSTQEGVSSALGIWVIDAHSGQVVGEPFRAASQFDFSPDNHLLAVKVLDEIRLLDAASHERQGQLSKHEAMEMLKWSPDGRLLATASAKRTVKLWDVARQRELQTISGHTGGVRCLCFSPDGRTLATGGDRRDPTIRLWNVLTGQMLFVLSRTADGVNKIEFSPDGRYFASVTRSGQFQLLDVAAE